MKSSNAESLLRVWEENHDAHPIRRALALLDAAVPAGGIETWAIAPIGQRDGRLLELYETLFGSRLQSVAHCPHCDEVLETSFTTADIHMQCGLPAVPGTFGFGTQGASIRYRLPNSDDLLHVIAATDDPDDARIQLLCRCVIEAKRAGRHLAPEQLPPDVVDRLAEEMARLDPGADVQIELNCPACGHAWSVCFDIVAYFWSALNDWAQRTLADVHLLACAYGWSEHEILHLSAARRQQYVEMVQA